MADTDTFVEYRVSRQVRQLGGSYQPLNSDFTSLPSARSFYRYCVKMAKQNPELVRDVVFLRREIARTIGAWEWCPPSDPD